MVLVLAFSSTAIAASPESISVEEAQPASESVAGAKNALLATDPETNVVWGRYSGHPKIVSGFTPVETDGDFDGAVRQFLNEHAGLWGFDDARKGADEVDAAIGAGEIVYDCRRDEVGVLEGLTENEKIEPVCAEITIVTYPQFVRGLRFRSGNLAAIFDSKDRLMALRGEFLGRTEVPAVPWVDEEQALAVVEDRIDVEGTEATVLSTDLGYAFFDEILPVWRIDAVGGSQGRDVSYFVNAETGDLIGERNNVDGYIDDTYDAIAQGYSLDNEAAHVCNEPGLRQRWVDTSYRSSSTQFAFNPDVHVYDLQSSTLYYTTPDDQVFEYTPRGSNSGTIIKMFNYKCVLDYIGDGCRNSVNSVIGKNDINTWTVFHHMLYVINYFRSLGFTEEVQDSGDYPDGHNLNVIVNRNYEWKTDELCGEAPRSCFRERGFPNTSSSIYDDLWPVFSVDRYVGWLWKPTIVLWGNEVYESKSGTHGLHRTVRHGDMYHEFIHYIEKLHFADDYWGGNYNKTTSFLSEESKAYKEGFAMYFGASLGGESESNFYMSQRRCRSDSTFHWSASPHQGIADANMQYSESAQCCGGEYALGRVLDQILWDLEEGIGTGVDELGKSYVHRLAYLTIAEVWHALVPAQTMYDLYLQMDEVAHYDLAGECPVGADCRGSIEAAFNRHGVCTNPPCLYLELNEISGISGDGVNEGCLDLTCFSGAPYDPTSQDTLEETDCEARYCHTPRPDSPYNEECDGFSGERRDVICCETVCVDPQVDSCNGALTPTQCEALCANDLWRWEYRDCLTDNARFNGSNCSACEVYK
ncbi:MAG: PepSY domain-containing protein [Deltaproteobacteria bacterium]|nr:PepSY domain-containing protein [Deltaproteobacteria bacterium]